MIHICKQKNKKLLHLIIDWTDKDVWDFIKQKELKYCCLYDEGYKRIGCVMCPMQNKKGMLKDAKRYPNFYRAYLKAFKRMLKIIKDKKLNNTWETEQDVMNWWIYGKDKNKNENLLFKEEQIFNYE